MVFSAIASTKVDFNSVEEDGTLLIERGTGFMIVPMDEAVTLQDFEGHTCLAVIDSVAASTVAVRPLWETWRPAPDHVMQVTSPHTLDAPLAGEVSTSQRELVPA